MRSSHYEQIAHGLLVVDDVGDDGRQRVEARAAAFLVKKHLEREPNGVQVDALRVVAVVEASCG